MICILKDDYNSYRYAIAKACFIRQFKSFKVVYNIPKSNVLYVRDNRTRIIKLNFIHKEDENLGQKIESIRSNKEYYISVQFRKRSQDFIDEYNLAQEYKDYIKAYGSDFELAVTDSANYMNKIGNQKTLFEGILVSSFESDDMCYKYYRSESIESNKYGSLDGKISFSSPVYFNDPFDVNCYFKDGTDIRDLFRILCVAPSYKEILMWSYYSSDHKGYCLKYNKNKILNAIKDTNLPGILLVGNVDYKDKRPAQKSSLNKISYTEVKFYINAAFSKYEKWNHEKEFRFVFIYNGAPAATEETTETDNDAFINQYESTPGFLTVSVDVEEIYQGCEGNRSQKLIDSNGTNHPYKIVIKDSADYLLK